MKRKTPKRKSALGWAVRHWRGGIYANTTSERRCDAVTTFRHLYGVTLKDWRLDVKAGVHRAIRVQIIPQH